MIPFHTLCPEIAQREVRCLHIGPKQDVDKLGPPPGEYAFMEFYCEDIFCDCRRGLIEVISKEQPGKVFACMNVGWESEAFYRKRLEWDPDAARGLVRGELDPLNEQSEFAEFFLETFQDLVLDTPYRLRLRRHHRQFREELAKRPPGHLDLKSVQ